MRCRAGPRRLPCAARQVDWGIARWEVMVWVTAWFAAAPLRSREGRTRKARPARSGRSLPSGHLPRRARQRHTLAGPPRRSLLQGYPPHGSPRPRFRAALRADAAWGDRCPDQRPRHYRSRSNRSREVARREVACLRMSWRVNRWGRAPAAARAGRGCRFSGYAYRIGGAVATVEFARRDNSKKIQPGCRVSASERRGGAAARPRHSGRRKIARCHPARKPPHRRERWRDGRAAGCRAS